MVNPAKRENHFVQEKEIFERVLNVAKDVNDNLPSKTSIKI
jgi:hypothetical protein